ncbi:MAG: tetratricopeptide repeat protein [Chloroflexi bacterium]|nr:tetratricopeptide repeat protein [Chloroflexota bacterium]
MDDRPELLTIWDEARGHIDTGDYDRAIETYRYILIRYHDDDVAVEYANAYLGDLFLTIQELALARKHLVGAIGYAPEKPHYHYLLGFTYSKMEEWEAAISELEAAVELEPTEGEYVRALGWATFNGRDKPEGLAQLHRAAELAPDNADILTDLAAAFLTMGNLDKAREYGKEALGIDPGHTLAQDLLRNIDLLRKKFG